MGSSIDTRGKNEKDEECLKSIGPHVLVGIEVFFFFFFFFVKCKDALSVSFIYVKMFMFLGSTTI